MTNDEENGCDCKPGLPAWLATFADLMSLLMCFFVLLLSFSEMDAMKFKRLAGSMAQAFGVQSQLDVNEIPKGTSIIADQFSPGRPEPTPLHEIWQHTENTTEMSLQFECAEEFDVEQGEEGLEAGVEDRVKQVLQDLIKQTEQDAHRLASALEPQITAGEVEVETRGRKIIVRIRESGSFASGSADLKPGYRDVMDEIRAVLAHQPGRIQVQGHSDDVPIRTARFRSNWELSAARAVSVAHELMDGALLKASRFEVSGMADTRPLVPNSNQANRARNRRVEIVIEQGLGEAISEQDKELLQTEEGEDILRELELEPEYLFDLQPGEIF